MKRSGIVHLLRHREETPYCVECWERKWGRTWVPFAPAVRDDGGIMPLVYVIVVIGALIAGVPMIGGWFAPVLPSLKGMVIPVLIATGVLSYIALATRHERATKAVIYIGVTIAILIGAA